MNNQTVGTSSDAWTAGQANTWGVERKRAERILAAATIGATAGYHAAKRFGPLPAAVAVGAGAAAGVVIRWLWD